MTFVSSILFKCPNWSHSGVGVDVQPYRCLHFSLLVLYLDWLKPSATISSWKVNERCWMFKMAGQLKRLEWERNIYWRPSFYNSYKFFNLIQQFLIWRKSVSRLLAFNLTKVRRKRKKDRNVKLDSILLLLLLLLNCSYLRIYQSVFTKSKEKSLMTKNIFKFVLLFF